MSTRARRSGGGRHFQVGRRRHVPVVDTGCGCRPLRPRLLSLPSFLKPYTSKPVPARSASHSSSGFFPSSSSTVSFSSSSAATYTTNYSSSNFSNYYYSHGYSAGTKKQVQDPPAKAPPAPVKRQLSTKKKRRYVEKAAAEEVGVAVEKESSDPRADFRESMVQMVVEMGLCDWDDLRCMLRRLLALNAPRHHAAILTAFAEVCAQLAAPTAPPPAYHQHRR